MRHFEIAHTAAVGHFDPAVEAAEVKGVAIPVLFDLHQLHRRPLTANLRVQRRRKQRRQQQVDPVVDGAVHKLLQPAPMPPAPRRVAIMGRDAVGMKPAGVDQPLRRQHHGHDLQHETLAAEQPAAVTQAQCDLMPPLYAALRHSDLHPQRPPLPRRRVDSGVQSVERVGIQPRCRPQYIVVEARAQKLSRHQTHRAHFDMARKRRRHLHLYALNQFLRSIGHLKRIHLTAQARPRLNRRVLQFFVGKYLA